MTNRLNHAPIYIAIVAALAAAPAYAQNVTVTEPPAGGFVVNSSANAPLFAIDANGNLTIANLAGATQQNTPLCFSGSGVLGPCAPGSNVGPQGPQGVQGPQGTQGPIGAQGVQGYQGADGVQGSQGPQGADGAGSITALTTYAPSGQNPGPTGAEVTITATCDSGIAISGGCRTDNPNNNLVASFMGASNQWSCEYISGASGSSVYAEVYCAAGSQGPQGSQGSQGPTGGATGSQGSQGTQGPTGSQGPTGPQGP